MCGRLYLDTMHVDRANLIIGYLSIWWSDLKTGNTVAIVRISRSFLWYAINELMNVMQRQNHACNENKLMHVMQLWFLGYMDGHSSHSPWLNHECKIECLQNAPHWQSLESEYQCKTKTLILVAMIWLWLNFQRFPSLRT